MARRNSKSDLARLKEIMNIMTKPYAEFDFMDEYDALEAMINPDKYPIYKRKVIRPIKIKGLWWMDEEQWTRFLWQGHHGTVIKDGSDPDRFLTTRTFSEGSLWIREMDDSVDIEGRCKTMRWDLEKKKSLGGAWEWLTVTISKEVYLTLDNLLGDRHDGCNHQQGALRSEQSN